MPFVYVFKTIFSLNCPCISLYVHFHSIRCPHQNIKEIIVWNRMPINRVWLIETTMTFDWESCPSGAVPTIKKRGTVCWWKGLAVAAIIFIARFHLFHLLWTVFDLFLFFSKYNWTKKKNKKKENGNEWTRKQEIKSATPVSPRETATQVTDIKSWNTAHSVNWYICVYNCIIYSINTFLSCMAHSCELLLLPTGERNLSSSHDRL